jgi:hypothetical protein
MKQTRSKFEFLHSYVYLRAVTCVVLTTSAGLGFLPVRAEAGMLSSSVQSVQQSNVTVEGFVKDANGDPIIGASVTEKGVASNATVTNLEGYFKLSVRRGAMLNVSYVGFVSQSVPLGKAGSITLKEDLKSLNEVVVIGYGTQRKGRCHLSHYQYQVG